ncbi:hypothetical protein DFH28DRAFT_1121009 [Melampsora americana]|nr:hypothetical protein DFH28DRAFT_1121009 [Melampsora americana]
MSNFDIRFTGPIRPDIGFHMPATSPPGGGLPVGLQAEFGSDPSQTPSDQIATQTPPVV